MNSDTVNLTILTLVPAKIVVVPVLNYWRQHLGEDDEEEVKWRKKKKGECEYKILMATDGVNSGKPGMKTKVENGPKLDPY